MTTIYKAELGNGQSVYLQQQTQQTLVTLTSAASGQQQSQSTGISTGVWTASPTVFRTDAGAIVRIETAQGATFIQLQSGSIQSLTQPPALSNATVIPLQQTTAETAPPLPEMRPMKPMRPMQPMKMGDMEMQMNPMQMRMGNMQMQMGGAAQGASQRFCTQCGNAIAPEDKFCGRCGFQLRKD